MEHGTGYGGYGWVAAPPSGWAHLIPKKSEWKMKASGVIYWPDEGKEPNAFHRLMQRLVLGFKWEKVK